MHASSVVALYHRTRRARVTYSTDGEAMLITNPSVARGCLASTNHRMGNGSASYSRLFESESGNCVEALALWGFAVRLSITGLRIRISILESRLRLKVCNLKELAVEITTGCAPKMMLRPLFVRRSCIAWLGLNQDLIFRQGAKSPQHAGNSPGNSTRRILASVCRMSV